MRDIQHGGKSARILITTLFILTGLASSGTPVASRAQASNSTSSRDSIDLTTVGKDPRWKIAGRAVSAVEIKGKQAIKVGEGGGIGVVWFDGYDFANGVIDVDLLGRSEPVQGSFLGIAFRVVDAQTHDVVYFRPFNFRAADSARRSHAVQ
jgi:hypothetical protein